MDTVLITGASGLIGRHLSRTLKENGYRVLTLSRKPKDSTEYRWDPSVGFIDSEAVKQADHIVHLAGAGIGDERWTSARKKEIVDSRVASCDLLYRSCHENGVQPRSFISASAVGFYGYSKSEVFTESAKVGLGFLAEVCAKWESAALRFERDGVRTVRLRTGIVLSADGGILPQMALPVRMGLGTPLGSGKQSIPWIHVQDLCRIYLEAIRQEHWSGVFNAVAPEWTSNRMFTKSLAQLFHKPFWPIPIPGLLLQLLLGERSELLVEGNRVKSTRLLEMEFSFQFNTLEQTLRDLYPNP